MVTAIWGAAVVVITTDGVEAEGIITAGGIIATNFKLLEAASVGGLFHFNLLSLLTRGGQGARSARSSLSG